MVHRDFTPLTIKRLILKLKLFTGISKWMEEIKEVKTQVKNSGNSGKKFNLSPVLFGELSLDYWLQPRGTWGMRRLGCSLPRVWWCFPHPTHSQLNVTTKKMVFLHTINKSPLKRKNLNSQWNTDKDGARWIFKGLPTSYWNSPPFCNFALYFRNRSVQRKIPGDIFNSYVSAGDPSGFKRSKTTCELGL